MKQFSEARVIVNPIAGAGKTGRQWPDIKALLEKNGLCISYDLTEAPGHATDLAIKAAEMGYELIISVGGDGTTNEIVNGLYQAGSTNNTILGIVPTGTGRDYARTVGIPRHWRDACTCLTNPRKCVVDLGLVEYTNSGQAMKRVFVNFAGLGFDAEIVKATTQRFKSLGGIPSYLMGLLTTVLSYRNQELSLTMDGQTEDRKSCVVLLCNGKYGGGGMFAAPQANLGDGLLDMVMIDELSKPELLWSLPRIYKGTHLSHPKVTARQVTDIEIRPKQHIALQADGELLGEAPAHFSVVPSALNIAVQCSDQTVSCPR
ncbi:MAG: diacylglycerol kinase family lipid kinase [Chloroflexota bacterium]|nr:diacylglycerol kinase family lipid kinase [Chloroflexota bacterium]